MAVQSKARKMVGLVVAPLMVVAGAALCLYYFSNTGVPVRWVVVMGATLIVAGVLWLASDWLDL